MRKPNKGNRKPKSNQNNPQNKQSNKPKSLAKTGEELIRLNKYIANSGVCSRRDADIYIASGNVMVNGKVVTEMGHKVKPSDEVKFDGKRLNPEKMVYVVINKPKNLPISDNNTYGKPSVMALVQNNVKTKSELIPVGRLDRNATGLMILTNDGKMAKDIAESGTRVSKLYHLTLSKNMRMEDIRKLETGFQIEGHTLVADEVSYIDNAPKSEIGLQIQSGRSSTIRQIFEHLGYPIVKLDRVIFGGITKKDLPRGHWRYLTEQEVINLKMMVGA
ncbi:MAG: RNA-binding S4 domain-containing protein [Flavobacteriaceae bacterium]|nr:RNA-binding S4 domain-containing protein [Flavobacteriaceae bacterium]